MTPTELIAEARELLLPLRCTKSENKKCATCPYAVLYNGKYDFCETQMLESTSANAIEALCDLVEKLQNAQRWIPVEERFPTVGAPVNILLKSGNVGMAVFDGNGWHCFVCKSCAQDDEVAHWQPMPSPPKGED